MQTCAWLPMWAAATRNVETAMDRQREDEQELAQAILTGAERRGKQSFGTYFGPEGGSCALGAAYEGVYLLPDEVRGTHPRRMDRFFHCLEDVSKRCPAG